MIKRFAREKIVEMAKKFPILAFIGPRQSGKTTLSKILFPDYTYVSLENPDKREFAQNDPKGFLKQYNSKVIIDEVQNVPELFSYLQQIVDEKDEVGQFILSGSQNFLLLEKITQSLAGRVYLVELLPLSLLEISSVKSQTLAEAILTGGYPRIYDKNIAPSDYYPSYINTYIERDVRTIINIHDLSSFQRFVTICASQIGQIFNANSISKELGISVKTVKSWLSILETSFIAFTLKPWYRNFSKRTIKSPKLYFYDTGLVSSLLGLEEPKDILESSFKGALFENFAMVEIVKNHNNKGLNRWYHFWRDTNGNEIDLIIEKGQKIQCVEMKFSQTVKTDYLKSLHYIDKLEHQLNLSHYLINGADETEYRTNETIVGWNNIDMIT